MCIRIEENTWEKKLKHSKKRLMEGITELCKVFHNEIKAQIKIKIIGC